MPLYPSCSNLNEKRWVELKDLSEAQRSILEDANVNRDDHIAFLDANCPTPRLTNQQVLDEGEIRAWMALHQADLQHAGFRIFKKMAPSLYEEFRFDLQFKGLSPDEFIRARDAAVELIDFFLKETQEKRSEDPAPDILPLSYSLLSPDFLAKLGKNSGLAFGMIDLVWSLQLAPSLSGRRLTVQQYRSALTTLKTTIRRFETLPSFMAKPPRDPLRYPDGTNPARHFHPAHQVLNRHGEAPALMDKLSRHLEELAFQNHRPSQKDLLYSSSASRQELLDFARLHFGDETHDALRDLLQEISRQYDSPGQPPSLETIDRLGIAWAKIMSRHGYYVQLAWVKGAHGSERWALLHGEIVNIQKYASFDLGKKSKVQCRKSPLQVYYVRDLKLSDKKAPLYLAKGVTTPTVEREPISIVNLDFQPLQHRFLKNAKSSWALDQWRDLTRGWSDEEILYAIGEEVTFHELAHNWRKSTGRSFDNYGFEEKSVEEGSSAYASIAFSEHPITNLLFLISTLPSEPDPADGKATLTFDFHQIHHRGLMEFLMDLAAQYGVKIPGRKEERLKTEWVRELVEKIRNATPNHEANESILRAQVAHAYAKRFGVPLFFLQSTIPKENIVFREDS
jgi:hypothetical protein